MKKKIDIRTLPAELIEEKRRTARELGKQGMTRAEIGKIVGAHADTVGKWLKLKEKDLALKKRGRKAGDQKLLFGDHEKRIKNSSSTRLPISSSSLMRYGHANLFRSLYCERQA